MIRLWLAVAALGGGASVIAGAVAAHLADDPKAADLLRTGALYGMVHAAALTGLIGLAQGREPRRAGAVAAGWCFAIGILLFSGSLFVLAAGGDRRFGWVTPIGGIALIVGWLALGIPALPRR